MSEDKTPLITPDMKVGELLDAYPELESVLIETAPAFRKLQNPVLRKTVAKVTSLERAAGVARIPIRDLLLALRTAVGQPTGAGALSAVPDGSACGCSSQAGDEPCASAISEATEVKADLPPEWFVEERITQMIDAKALLATGEVPISQVIQAAKTLSPTDILRVAVEFEPLPLIEMLQQRGFSTFCRRSLDGQFELFVAGQCA